MIRELAAGGMTMLIATHEMGFARDIANRVCFLDAGVILEQGPPAQIFSAAARAERTQQFLAADHRRRDGCACRPSTSSEPMLCTRSDTHASTSTLEPLDD